ncbi:hypothetical protein [Natrinema longum]|uniref:Major facilitator superfamily (MFS) profile domain-containing protein n=1 Tax=Natrinema longum TaxID=370324 RepID=A0A8A2U6S7_9EURY|nr:hypothetical protein [Natrinema longum]MBZ6494394.1 hypothetical protein [Natrinema longum]QSW84283.1 hypothetical protein J0X27_12585 [Natrinema longum]
MLDTVVEFVLELGVDVLIDRNDDRTLGQQLCLFLGIVVAVLAIALAIVSGPLYGLGAGVIALALLVCGA